MFGSFLPSLWSSSNQSLLRSREPTLLCNQVLESILKRLSRKAPAGVQRTKQRPIDNLAGLIHLIRCLDDERPEGVRRCDRGGGSFWGVDGVASCQARQEGCADRCIWSCERAGQLRGRIAHHSNGLRRG